ncbi:hypothetical protein HOY82DRAFT_668273 [Tuber indicum]|nr:hypothetical protein HOY82DRAFT_668273 [Tuber indicum]
MRFPHCGFTTTADNVSRPPSSPHLTCCLLRLLSFQFYYRQLPKQRFPDSGQALSSYASSSNVEVRGGPPIPPTRPRYHVPNSAPSSYPRSTAYTNATPNTGVVPSQPLDDILSFDHNSWWPEIPEEEFNNPNPSLDLSEYGNIWPQLGGPLNSNDFHQLPEIPQVAGGEYFPDFSAEMIQGSGIYGPGLEEYDPQQSIPSAKGKKDFPQTPPPVLHSTDVPSSQFITSGPYHSGRTFTASSGTPVPPTKPLSSTPNATPELTISPEPRINQTLPPGAHPHLGPGHVVLAGQHGMVYAPRQFIVPARSRKGCWTCRIRKVKCDEIHPVCGHCKRLKHQCDFTPRYTYKDDSPAKDLESIADRSGNPNPQRFIGNDWRPRHGTHVLPVYKFAECVRDADREMLAAQHKPGSFFVVATCQTFESRAKTLSPGIPTCYYTVALSDLPPPRSVPVSVTILEFLRTDPGALPNLLGGQQEMGALE